MPESDDELITAAIITRAQLERFHQDHGSSIGEAITRGRLRGLINMWCAAMLEGLPHRIAYETDHIMIIEHDDGSVCQVIVINPAPPNPNIARTA